MDGILVAVGGFFGATFGSVIAGYLIESYRQKNRLQLAAVDKRLEAYQEGYRRVVDIGIRVSERREGPCAKDEALLKLRSEAIEWLKRNYLYLGVKIGVKLHEAFTSDDEKQADAALIALQQAAGLPSVGGKWRNFRKVI